MRQSRTEHTASPRRKPGKRAFAAGLLSCACLLVCASLVFFAIAQPAPATHRGVASAVAQSVAQAASDAPGAPSVAAEDASSKDAGGPAQQAAGQSADVALSPDPDEERPVYVPGEMLVVLDSDTSLAAVNAYLESADYIATKRLSADDAAQGIATVQLAQGVDVSWAVERFGEECPQVPIQPNFCYYAQEGEGDAGAQAQGTTSAAFDMQANGEGAVATGSSALLAAQAAISNDTNVSQQWALEKMHVPEAWSLLSTRSSAFAGSGSNPIGVAVFDLGFNVTHVDLKNRVAVQYNSVTGTSDVSEVASQNGHGTHVAGAVGAQVNNGLGIAGVSHNANLMLVKVFDDDTGATTASLVAAYNYLMGKNAGFAKTRAQQYNIRVINVSMGGANAIDSALEAAINRAFNAGIVTVCSAGNVSSASANYPSDYPNAVGVINVTKQLERYYRSNFNRSSLSERTKDISAPGTSIFSTIPGGYGEKTGTSMAAPQVTGVLSLIFAADPSLTSQQAVDILYSTATDLNTSENLSGTTFDYKTGWGLANAQAAVARALGVPQDTAAIPVASESEDAGTSTSASNAASAGSSSSGAMSSGASANPSSTTATTTTTTTTTTPVSSGASASPSAATSSSAKTTAAIKLNSANITLSATAYTYNGKPKKPGVIVKRGATTLKAGTDYTLKYASNTNAGTAKVIVTGKGAYTGAVTKTFTIAKAKQPLTVKAIARTVKYSQVKRASKKLARPLSVKKAQGTVTYKKLSGNKKIAINATTGKVKVAKGLKPGTYKVKIKVRAKGTPNYKSGTKTVTTRIRVK